MSEVGASLREIRDRIDVAARRAGRDPAEVTLIGASKLVPAARIAEALDAGLTDVGENRAQELLAKAPILAERPVPPRWHFVGRLQRNKVAALTPWVGCWHSVDRPALGEAIARRAPGARVLVEALSGLDLDVDGLMTVAPLDGDPRGWFAALRDLGIRLGLRELSMGMSADFEAAIEEGATMVRVGRAIFGARPL